MIKKEYTHSTSSENLKAKKKTNKQRKQRLFKQNMKFI